MTPELQRLSDRAAIEDVIYRYATAFDARDAAGVASCFTDDATAEFGGVAVTGGGVAIAAFLHLAGGVPRPEPTAGHYFTNVRVTIGEGTAHAESYAISCRPGPDAPERFTMRGLRYHDDLVRADGSWRIARRVHNADWQLSAVNVPVTPMAAQPRTMEKEPR